MRECIHAMAPYCVFPSYEIYQSESLYLRRIKLKLSKKGGGYLHEQMGVLPCNSRSCDACCHCPQIEKPPQ